MSRGAVYAAAHDDGGRVTQPRTSRHLDRLRSNCHRAPTVAETRCTEPSPDRLAVRSDSFEGAWREEDHHLEKARVGDEAEIRQRRPPTAIRMQRWWPGLTAGVTGSRVSAPARGSG